MLGFTAPPRSMATDTGEEISPPENVTAPVLFGSFFVGQTLMCPTGVWSGDPDTFQFRWKNNGSLNGDEDDQYTTVSGDDGDQLLCEVRAGKSGVWSDWVASNALYAIQLALWLDASDSTTISHMLNSVSLWSDKAGFSRHQSQGSSSLQPTTNVRSINARNSLFYNLDTMSGDRPFSSGNFNIFCVSQMEGARSFDDVWAFTSGIRQEVDTAEQWRFYATNGSSTGGIDDTAIGDALVPSIVSLRRSGSNLEGRYNGGNLLFGTGTPTFGTGSLFTGSRSGGGAEMIVGHIGEIIMAARDLSAAEQNQIGAYLGNKWGITWTNI